MKMKSLVSLILACVCLFSVVSAENAAPSPSLTKPVIQVVVKKPEPVKEDTAVQEGTAAQAPAGEQAPAEQPSIGLVIEEVEIEKMPESTVKLFEQIQQAAIPVVIPTLAPTADTAEELTETPEAAPAPMQPIKVDISTIVPEETVTQIIETLPETSKVEDLVITEFIPLNVYNYEREIGTVHVQIVSAVEYKPEETVTVVMGVWDGEKMVWFVPQLLRDENGMFIEFTEEMLALMEISEPVLMLMSDMEAIEQQPAPVV